MRSPAGAPSAVAPRHDGLPDLLVDTRRAFRERSSTSKADASPQEEMRRFAMTHRRACSERPNRFAEASHPATRLSSWMAESLAVAWRRLVHHPIRPRSRRVCPCTADTANSPRNDHLRCGLGVRSAAPFLRRTWDTQGQPQSDSGVLHGFVADVVPSVGIDATGLGRRPSLIPTGGPELEVLPRRVVMRVENRVAECFARHLSPTLLRRPAKRG